jgi:ComF family protein
MAYLKHYYNIILTFLLPNRCPSCSDIVDKQHSLCVECWNQMAFISKPWCEVCGIEHGPSRPCDRFLFSHMRSLFYYDDFSKSMILRFKHADATFLAQTFADWMIKLDPDYFKGIDVIIPVPLHWSRLLKRGYNQSTLVARLLSHHLNIPICTDLKRIIATKPQSGNKKNRANNIKNALKFQGDLSLIAHKTILIIDDVFTTGSTLQACAAELKKFKPAQIKCFTVSRLKNTQKLTFN